MVDDVFSAADITSCPALLGVGLRPFSIWHSWALKTIASPFVTGGKYELDDLCKAVVICSLTREGHAVLSSEGDTLTAYYGLVAGEYIAMGEEDRRDVIESFGTYIDECTVLPEFYEDEKFDPNRDRLRCPMEWHLVHGLLAMRVCESENDAWDYPLARAHCWQAVYGESKGSKAYVDPVDRKDFKELEGVANGDNTK